MLGVGVVFGSGACCRGLVFSETVTGKGTDADADGDTFTDSEADTGVWDDLEGL